MYNSLSVFDIVIIALFLAQDTPLCDGRSLLLPAPYLLSVYLYMREPCAFIL